MDNQNSTPQPSPTTPASGGGDEPKPTVITPTESASSATPAPVVSPEPAAATTPELAPQPATPEPAVSTPAPSAVDPSPSISAADSTPAAPATPSMGTPASDTSNTGAPSTTPDSTQPAVSMPAEQPAPTVNPPHHPHALSLPTGASHSRLLMLVALVLVTLVAVGAAVYFALAQNNARDEVSSLEGQVASLDSNYHELPEGAIEVSECVPNMGHHYLPQGADPKFGPYVLVSSKGKVIGYEYMFNEAMMTPIPGIEEQSGFPIDILLTDGPVLLNDWQYNSVEFSRSPAGHIGFEEPHYDIHLYTVNPDEQKASCEQ